LIYDLYLGCLAEQKLTLKRSCYPVLGNSGYKTFGAYVLDQVAF